MSTAVWSLSVLTLAATMLFSGCDDFASSSSDECPPPARFPAQTGELGLWGFIDSSGKEVIPARFRSETKSFFFCGPRTGVEENGRWGIINEKGEWIVRPQYLDIASLLEPIPVRDTTDRWGYIDSEGVEVVRPQFDSVGAFKAGLAPVKVGTKWGFIDTEAKIQIAPQFDEVGVFSADGLAPVRMGKWGFINRTGGFAINPQFDGAGRFTEDLAAVSVGDLWGYIRPDGQFVIEPKFSAASVFHEGFAAVTVQPGLTGIIDHSGKFIIAPKFTRIDRFSEGLAAVWQGDLCGYVDKSGNFRISPDFSWCGHFQGPLAPVDWDQDHGYSAWINREGNPVWIWKPTKSSLLPYPDVVERGSSTMVAAYSCNDKRESTRVYLYRRGELRDGLGHAIGISPRGHRERLAFSRNGSDLHVYGLGEKRLTSLVGPRASFEIFEIYRELGNVLYVKPNVPSQSIERFDLRASPLSPVSEEGISVLVRGLLCADPQGIQSFAFEAPGYQRVPRESAQRGTREDRFQVNGVSLGMSQAAVRQILGPPRESKGPYKKYEITEEPVIEWTYPGTVIDFSRDRVSYLACSSGVCRIPAGVGRGSDREAIRKVYGLSTLVRGDSSWVYQQERNYYCGVEFIFAGNLVSQVHLWCPE